MIEVVQVNLHRARSAHDELENRVRTENIQICLLSETNKAINRRKTQMDEGWLGDPDGDTAIWITGRDRNLGIISKDTVKGCTWMVLTGGLLVVSCYYSPRRDLDAAFPEYLEAIENRISETGVRNHVITGDFNAAATEWGSSDTDRRGAELVDWCARNDWNIYNNGYTPTFLCNDRASFIDITLATPGIVTGWFVNEGAESHSDHQYVEFNIALSGDADNRDEPQLPLRWTWKKLDRPRLLRALDERCRALDDLGAPVLEPQISRILQEACSEAAPPAGRGHSRKKQAYWWNSELSKNREACLKSRRKYVRMHRRMAAKPDEFRQSLIEYTRAKRLYKRSIDDSKRRSWRELCDSVRADVWGLPYKIIRDRIGLKRLQIPQEKAEEAIRNLFPAGRQVLRTDIEVDTEQIPEVATEEIIIAADRMTAGKAPGPDGVPPEVTKALMKRHPTIVKRMAGEIFKTGAFPTAWKTARLVLIPKPNKKDAFRPICLLNTMAKGIETIINRRLQAEIEERNGLSETQYGFRRGRSTLMALQEVIDEVEEERWSGRTARCALSCCST